MIETLKKIGDFIYKLTLAIMFDIAIVLVGTIIYMETLSDYAIERKVNEIYNQIWRQTGQNQERLPLRIVDDNIINAYNNGQEIVIYTGLIKSTKSWDEIALVLGHEIAHGNLWHLRMLNDTNMSLSKNDIAVLEANADKMGAFYMIKARYDVCKGRELFKHWLDDQGDSLDRDHPDFAYRYNELNINCE